MTQLAHTKPCNVCPWRRESAPGWLGATTPVDFLQATLAEAAMPCHAAVDYEAPHWRDTLEGAPHCAGGLIFLRNVGKLPRDPELARCRNAVERDPAAVFATPGEFLEHHGK